MYKNIIAEITKMKKQEQEKLSEIREAKKFKNNESRLYREVEAERIHTNFIRIIPASVALLIVEICGMLWALWANIKFDYGIGFLISCCIFAFVSVLFVSAVEFLLKTQRTNQSQMKIIYTTYWVLYTAAAMSFAIMEALDRQTVNNYIIYVILFSVLPVITPFTKNLMFMVALYVEAVSLLFAMAEPMELIICLTVTIIGMFYSFIRFNHYLSVSITQKKLEFSANGDLLTSLMNRRGFVETAPSLRNFCKNNGYTFCLIMMDIDNFKMYNDRYGHLEGDICIKQIAACIKDNFSRPTDVCVRYGGEEFLVLTAQKDIDKLVAHLQQTIELVTELEFEKTLESVSISVGLYASAEEDFELEIDELVNLADKQLYNAKRNGKNCISYLDNIYR